MISLLSKAALAGVLVAACGAVSGGCGSNGVPVNGDAGGTGSGGKTGATGSGGKTGTTGTGGVADAGGTAGGVSTFIGAWQPTAAVTAKLNCAGTSLNFPITGNLTWAAGTTSDLKETMASSTCALNADVSGTTATALPNQSCMQTENGIPVTINFDSYTFVLGANGQTATETASGTGTATEAGQKITCTYSEMASYTKVPG